MRRDSLEDLRQLDSVGEIIPKVAMIRPFLTHGLHPLQDRTSLTTPSARQLFLAFPFAIAADS